MQRTAGGAPTAVPAAPGRAVDPGAGLGDDVEILRRDVHVARRAVGAAQRGDELAVPPEQTLARLAGGKFRHGEHGLAAAARHAGRGHLPRHRPRQAHRVGEAVGRGGIDPHARAAAGRPAHRGVHADEHPGVALGVVTHDRVLAVPAREEGLEVHGGRYRSTSRLHSAAGMAGERTKLVVAHRDRLGSAESRRLRKEGLVPGVLYGNGEPVAISIAERELRRALTGAAGLHSILDVEIDGKGRDARFDPQGVPGRPRAGRRHARRPAGGAARQADPGVGLGPVPRRRRRSGRARGRRALAAAARGQGRGVAARGAGASRSRRLGHGDRRHAAHLRPHRARRRHASRRSRDGRRHGHRADQGRRARAHRGRARRDGGRGRGRRGRGSGRGRGCRGRSRRVGGGRLRRPGHRPDS